VKLLALDYHARLDWIEICKIVVKRLKAKQKRRDIRDEAIQAWLLVKDKAN